ncbi:hypothetical protein HYC85_027352 [Camellia sinensis]|uniref:Auxin-responsive protein n=1 Tax=Camellia sinensis TaxID=4442 RepID=A0A7J7G674_CAMSI|nr:hypothetical protein HYC85_027352 [Camellia sinensis]
MELQLGLALPTHNPVKGFDLNQNGFDSKEMGGWWNDNECCLGNKILGNKKRGFDEAFEDGGERNGKLCVFSWNGQPNEEDDGRGERKGSSITIDKDDEEESHVVGWPPIKSWRKKLMHQHHQQGGRTRIVKDRTVERGTSNSTYVKVNMEGVPIGRKIDLRLYHSYHTLTTTLISMFAKCKSISLHFLFYSFLFSDQDCDKISERYTLTYQDKEGDWLLAGDVPWNIYVVAEKNM